MRQLRMVFAVLLLLAVLLPLQQANAGPEILGAISGTLWATKEDPTKSNPEQSISWSASAEEPRPGEPTAKFRSGNIEIPVSRYPIFPEMRYMRIGVEAFGIKPEFLKAKGTDLQCSGRLSLSDRAVVIDCLGLDDTQVYHLVTTVIQNQGRHDESGLLPIVLQLFGRKKHSQIESTDVAVKSFVVSNIDQWIEHYCDVTLGGADPMTLLYGNETTPDQKRAIHDENLNLIRAQYYLENFCEKISFSPKVDGANWYHQGVALRRQGFQAPLAMKPLGDNPETAALRRQVEELKAVFASSQALPEVKPTPEPPKPVYWKLMLPVGKVAIQVTRTPLNPAGNAVVSRPRPGYGWSGSYAANSLPGKSDVEVLFFDGTIGVWHNVDIRAGAVIATQPEFIRPEEAQ